MTGSKAPAKGASEAGRERGATRQQDRRGSSHTSLRCHLLLGEERLSAGYASGIFAQVIVEHRHVFGSLSVAAIAIGPVEILVTGLPGLWRGRRPSAE